MAWNQPGNNGKDRDPWGSGNNSQGDNSGNNKGRNQGAPDLDELLRKLTQKINSLLGGKANRSGGSGGGNGGMIPGFRAPSGGRIFGIGLAIIIIIWGFSGFYTIKEGERGVVTRFGQLSHRVEPGLNWKPTFIDDVIPVNVESVRELAASGLMLTADENVVRVEMNVQYRITDPEQYLFNVLNPDDSLRQATDSALRGVIGKYPMDTILTEGRTIIRNDTRRELENTVSPYKMGITLLDVNFQTARPPEEVKDAFDDAIAARENEQQYIREAEAYASEAQPRANGEAQKILAKARAFKTQTVLEAQGEVDSFGRLLKEYQLAPTITRERLYLESMERLLSHTHKVLIDNKGNNLMVLPLEQLLKGKNPLSVPATSYGSSTQTLLKSSADTHSRDSTASTTSSSNSDDIMAQRQVNAQRNVERR